MHLYSYNINGMLVEKKMLTHHQFDIPTHINN